MSSRRPVRQVLVAVLLGVLVGGGLMAVTPAGAEVSQAVATNWKKIWKKQIKPQADKRYFTKKKSNKRYQPKGSYEPAGSGYTKAETYSKGESDARYAGAGSGYTKAESDAKYAPYPRLIRGAYSIIGPATGVGQELSDELSFGVALAAAPTVHYINRGAPTPVGCSGTVAAPNASPGHLCVFEAQDNNVTTRNLINATGNYGLASPFGASVIISAAAVGNVYVYGSWAVRPAAPVTSARTVPTPGATGRQAGN